MTAQVKEELVGIGIDLEGAMNRFLNNEALLEKFLKKFLQDPNYNALLSAVESGSCEDAFRAGHTLKGVTGNLSLQPLYECVRVQVEYFRSGDFEKGAAMMPEVTRLYHEIIAALEKI
ncbi:MAG: Hpt domain-containing protein [Roseburia sp.]|nr:Hpt domain-containing protein [Roseburia sp.]